MTLLEIYKTALDKAYGKPYIWGAEGPFSFDCSGLIRFIFKQTPILPPFDQTADDLYHYFLKEEDSVNARGLGSLAFFGSAMHIHHVGFCIDEYVMLNAAGGGPEITTVDKANDANARVKIEPISLRKNLLATIKPPYWRYGIETGFSNR